jgi:hypothetical protein
MPALMQPTTATNNSNKGMSMQPTLPQHNKTTGNTSQDNSMQGTADGDNKVSIMVDKFFFQNGIKCVNSIWLHCYFIRVSLKLRANVTTGYVLTYFILNWN